MRLFPLLPTILALLLSSCPAPTSAANPGPGCGYVDIWLAGPRPPTSGNFDVDVWVQPTDPNASAQLAEVDVALDWDPRYITLQGTIYATAGTWSRGPDLPANWTGAWPIGSNTNWPGGIGRLHLQTPGICTGTLRVAKPLKLATLHFKVVRTPPTDWFETYIEIDFRFATLALGRWDADACHYSDRAASRTGCWLDLRGLAPGDWLLSRPLDEKLPVPVFRTECETVPVPVIPADDQTAEPAEIAEVMQE